MIILLDYWMGRDQTHAGELTQIIRDNAEELLARVNKYLAYAAEDGAHPTIDATTKTVVGSGWRPAGVNSSTANAAKGSKHLTGEAIDLRDGVSRLLARWAMANQHRMRECQLWAERPQWTPSWLHLQIVPPKSGNLIFVPSANPPLCGWLPGEPV